MLLEVRRSRKGEPVSLGAGEAARRKNQHLLIVRYAERRGLPFSDARGLFAQHACLFGTRVVRIEQAEFRESSNL